MRLARVVSPVTATHRVLWFLTLGDGLDTGFADQPCVTVYSRKDWYEAAEPSPYTVYASKTVLETLRQRGLTVAPVDRWFEVSRNPDVVCVPTDERTQSGSVRRLPKDGPWVRDSRPSREALSPLARWLFNRCIYGLPIFGCKPEMRERKISVRPIGATETDEHYWNSFAEDCVGRGYEYVEVGACTTLVDDPGCDWPLPKGLVLMRGSVVASKYDFLCHW